MVVAPLMPKATAVWLVENTALSFDQVAEFCKLHPLEVKAIADGDAAQGIKGLDPILTGQLSREEIEKAVADPDYRLKLLEPKVRLLALVAGVLLLFVGVATIASRVVRPLAYLLGAPGARLGGTAGSLARQNTVRNPARTASTGAAGT